MRVIFVLLLLHLMYYYECQNFRLRSDARDRYYIGSFYVEAGIMERKRDDMSGWER